MTAMMADQQLHLVCLSGLTECGTGEPGIGNRFLDQQIRTVAGKEPADLEVRLVGRRNDHCIEVKIRERPVVATQGGIELGSKRFGCAVEAGETDEIDGGDRCGQVCVQAADAAGADDGQPDRSKVGPISCAVVVAPSWCSTCDHVSTLCTVSVIVGLILAISL